MSDELETSPPRTGFVEFDEFHGSQVGKEDSFFFFLMVK